MIDYLDVAAGQPARQALLAQMVNQNAANGIAQGQFDTLNRNSAHALGLKPPPGLQKTSATGPYPSQALPAGTQYPGLPTSGTSAFLNIPRVVTQINPGSAVAGNGALAPLSDMTKNYLLARQQELASTPNPSILPSPTVA